MKSLYEEYLKIHELKNGVLNQCCDEQLQLRILRKEAVTTAPEEGPKPVQDFDCSDTDALVVAKDMYKIWSASLGVGRKYCPYLIALGTKLQSFYEEKKQAKETRSRPRGEAGKGERGEGQEGEEGKGDDGKGQEGDDGKGQEGDDGKGQEGDDGNGEEGEAHMDQKSEACNAEEGDSQGDEGEKDEAGNARGCKKKAAAGAGNAKGGKKKAAAVPAAKVDKNGRPMAVGDTVTRHASKLKDKYDNRKAKVERLNSMAALVDARRPC